MNKIQLNENNKIKKIENGYEYDIFLYADKNIHNNLVLLKQFKEIKQIESELLKIKKEYGFDDFNFNVNANIDKNYIENKRKKIEFIQELNCFKNDLQIYDIVLKDDNFVGYTLENKNLNHIDYFDRRKNKIKYLKLIREKIKMLNLLGIYIGNFSDKNFLISPDKNNILISNLDNLRVGNLNFDLKSDICKRFENNCSNDRNIDSFCFNIFTLSYLTKINDNYLLYNLKNFYLPYYLNNKENRNILDSMINLDDSYMPKYIIDNIR